MKLVVTSQGTDKDSQVDPRFGRAKFLLVVDLQTQEYTAVDNSIYLNAAQGAGIQAARRVVELGAEVLLTGHTGPKAFMTLQNGHVKVFTGVQGTVAEAVEQYKAGRLVEAEQADVEGHWA